MSGCTLQLFSCELPRVTVQNGRKRSEAKRSGSVYVRSLASLAGLDMVQWGVMMISTRAFCERRRYAATLNQTSSSLDSPCVTVRCDTIVILEEAQAWNGLVSRTGHDRIGF